MLNLYNFMDGSDGLAGGMTLIGFGCYGVTAGLAGNEPFADDQFLCGRCRRSFFGVQFLSRTYFHGRCRLDSPGISGRHTGYDGLDKRIWPLWLPVLVFSPFIADASVTLARRGLSGEKIWQAHRDHYYQRMVQSGFGHRNTALLGYILMLAAGASAIWAMHQHIAVQLGVGHGMEWNLFDYDACL